MDDYSRYIVHWELCSSIKVEDVKRTVDNAIIKARLITKRWPKLLSDKGSCYIGNELKAYLKTNHDMWQIHGRPLHPQTQWKIERYRRTIKNVIKLNNYYCPEELIKAIEEFVNRYYNEWYHELLKNLTPADAYYGRGELILAERLKIKQISLYKRKEAYEKMKKKGKIKNLD